MIIRMGLCRVLRCLGILVGFDDDVISTDSQNKYSFYFDGQLCTSIIAFRNVRVAHPGAIGVIRRGYLNGHGPVGSDLRCSSD